MNSQTLTKVYTQLTNQYGESVSEGDANAFIESYMSTEGIEPDELIPRLQESWDEIAEEYYKRAEKVFGVMLPNDVTAYLTINDRCPYSIEQGMFYVSSSYLYTTNKTAMHELWHFYTWFKYGIEWERKLGAEKYNEIKEALTVLLNVECKDLLPEGVLDKGYPQHQELRQKILDIWSKEQNMDNLWQALVA